MTTINRLTRIPAPDDQDLFVVWQNSNGRTRAISVKDFRGFIQSTDPNADAFVKAELVGDELILTAHDETETKININILPEHSVTELKDMPDELIAEHYIKVNDSGDGFVMTPASEVSASIIVQQDGSLVGSANVLDFSGFRVVTNNRVATIESIMNFANVSSFKIGDTEAEYISVDRSYPAITTDETTNNLELIKIIAPESSDSPPKIQRVYTGYLASGFSVCADGTTADTQILQASSGTYSLDTMVFAVGAAVDDPVYVGLDGKLTLDQSDYVVGWVLTDGVIIDIDLYNATVTAKSQSEDTPTFKSVDIDTAGSGNPNFAASIHQDGELHTVIDATRELRVNYKDIGTGTTTGVMSVDNNQAQFLVPIMQGVDPVALKKEIPVIPDNGYIEKYTKAETDYVQIAYQGKYGDDRVYYPSNIKQDVNGWLQFEYTGNLQFKPRDKNTDILSDATLRLGISRSDFYQPLYVEGKRVAERTSHHIYNTYSLNDLITNDNESFTEWMTNNPNYTQVQFLNTLFSCTVLGAANWIVSATTSGEDYNGTFPNSYQQIEIHRNGGGSRSFLRAYNKESPVHYFANYKANQELDWKQYAYTDELGVLKEKTSYDNEIQNIDTTGTGVFAEYLGYGSTSAAHTHTFDESGVFWISNLQSSTRPKTVNVISSNGAEMTGISVPFNRVVKFTYSSEIEEIITEASYADVDINSGTYVLEEDFNSKSGYSKLVSGGGSTHTITYSENGSILKISNPTVKVQLLQGMSDENPNGYIKYINSHNADVTFEWYDRNGNQVTNNVPSTCPADTVVEIFADHAKNEYVLSFGQSKVIQSINENDELMEGLASGVIYAKTVTVG